MHENQNNISDLWFDWFYKNWEKYCPGDLLEEGLSPSQIAERFIDKNENNLLNLSQNFDHKNYYALREYMKLSETELLVMKYFLKLIKLGKIK